MIDLPLPARLYSPSEAKTVADMVQRSGCPHLAEYLLQLTDQIADLESELDQLLYIEDLEADSMSYSRLLEGISQALTYIEKLPKRSLADKQTIIDTVKDVLSNLL